MSESNLILHRGASQVSETELLGHLAPEPLGRWYPLAHSRVLDVVKQSLTDVGYQIKRQQLGVMKDGSRFFGTLDLASSINPGVSLACGIRNSVDKSFPLGFVAGSRVFVCDNLSFRSELLVRRKHTINGEKDFIRRISDATAQLHRFEEEERAQIDRIKALDLAPEQADSLILRSFERGVITSRELPLVLHEWRNPPFEEFTPRNAWSLFNAFTSGLKERARTNPQQHALTTIRVSAMFGQPSNN